jgi:hypothetical protein
MCPRGQIFAEEQQGDYRNAITWLQLPPNVDPERISSRSRFHDVIVDVGATTFPLRRRVAFHRQRVESWLIQGGKQKGTRPFAFPERTLVQALQ